MKVFFDCGRPAPSSEGFRIIKFKHKMDATPCFGVPTNPLLTLVIRVNPSLEVFTDFLHSSALLPDVFQRWAGAVSNIWHFLLK